MIRLLLVALVVAAAVLSSCGDDNPAKPTVFIHLSPMEQTLGVGEDYQFTATVLGTTNFGVRWEVLEGAAHGTISEDGLYTAPNTVPNPATATVKATSEADTTKTAESTLTIILPELAVSVAPAVDTLHVGLTGKFTATVTGSAVELVTWSVDDGAAHGTIDQTGFYTSPAILPDPPEAIVRATSVADATKSGTATVMLYASGPPPPGFVRVPGGSFTMGDGESVCGSDEDLVSLTKDFYLGQTEVTNAQYREMVQWAYDQGYVTATTVSVTDALGSGEQLLNMNNDRAEIAWRGGVFSLNDSGHGINPDHPVKRVTWYGAAAYCNWLSLREGLEPAYDHITWKCNGGDPYRAWGYRLPTDAEWEYAAQYDDERIHPWGNGAATPDRANYDESQIRWTTGVESYPIEKRIGGDPLYGMAGNVWEWCNDWYACSADPDPTDPAGPWSGTDRVRRGGAWNEGDFFLRCAARLGTKPYNYADNWGFRVARTANR